MADNVALNVGSGGKNAATDEATYSGDTAQVQLVRVVHVIGAEGSKTVAEKDVQTRSDTFTTTANGTAVDVSTFPMKYFGLQCTETGTVSSWSVILEGSLDGTTYSTIMTHTKATDGSGATIWNPVATPCRFFRSRCSAITLGGGTNVVARIVGMN